MAMSADQMFANYVTNLAALGITFNHSESEAMIKALFQSIIDDIVGNATIQTTSGAPDGEHTGNVSG